MDTYRTVTGLTAVRLTRERSRFLASVEPAARDAVEGRLIALRRQHHDATHVCSAFRCREGTDSIVSVSDDAGEPRGSAGLPILQQLEAAGLVDVLAVVVRHFGGVKLGIGGLVRAYGDATAAALARAEIAERHVETLLRVAFPHEAHAAVLRVVHRFAARVVDIRYDTHGVLVVALPPSRAASFVDVVREETGARATVERVT